MKHLITIAALIFVMGVAQGAEKAAQSFDIGAQELAAALNAFAKQTKKELLYPPKLVENRKTAGVKGDLEPMAALSALLKDTGLRYSTTPSGAIVLSAGEAAGSAGGAADQMRLAAADTAKEGGSSKEEDKDSKDGQQVVVQGKRDKAKAFSEARIDIQRTEDDVLPFTVFTADEIRFSGATSLQEFLQMRLPQNAAGADMNKNFPTASGVARNAFVNQLNVRGWGGGEVAVLVDGRKLPRQSISIEPTQLIADYNSVPIASIERIEFLTSAGSAIYGESATSGVINIITKRSYSGGTVALNVEAPTDGDASNRGVDISYARPLGWGIGMRTTLSAQRTTPLTLGDRADVTTERWRRLVSERNPAQATVDSDPPLSAATNVTGYGTPLFGPGTPATASVAQGYSGAPTLSAFAGRQGVQYRELFDGYSDRTGAYGGSKTFLGNETERQHFSVGFDKDFGSNWRLSLDYTNQANEMSVPIGGTENIGIIYMDSAAHPFGPSVGFIGVTFHDPNYNRYSDVFRSGFVSKSESLSVTLRGQRGAWRTVLDATRSIHSNHTYLRELTGARLNNANYQFGYFGFPNAISEGLYNPFVDMRVAAPAGEDFYENYTYLNTADRTEYSNTQATARASGPVLSLPAGDAVFTGGLDWAKQERDVNERWVATVHGRTKEVFDPTTTQLGTLFAIASYSAYGEIEVPVVSAFAGEAKLLAFASGRVSRDQRNGRSPGILSEYDSDSHLYAGGIRLSLFENVHIRTSISTGFQSPTFSQIAPGTQSTSNLTVQDRRRNNQNRTLTGAMRVSGGNLDIEPESTSSANIGVTFAPKSIPGFRLSIDYVDSLRDNAIASVTPQMIVDLESDPIIATRIRRAAPEPNAPNGVGLIEFVDARTINFRKISSAGIDIAAEYEMPDVRGGRMHFSVLATQGRSFKVQSSASTAPVEQVRNRLAAFRSQQLEWNANSQIRWIGEEWQIGWSSHFYDSILVAPSYFVVQAGDRIPWSVEHDLTVGYRPSRGESAGRLAWFLDGTSFTVGIKNILDHEPRFDARSVMGGIPEGLYRRSAWMQMRKEF